MEEMKKLLYQVIANQVVIYKKLDEVEHKVKGGSRLASIDIYAEELKKKASEVLSKIKTS
jgi:hypothetical protein